MVPSLADSTSLKNRSGSPSTARPAGTSRSTAPVGEKRKVRLWSLPASIVSNNKLYRGFRVANEYVDVARQSFNLAR